MHLTVVIHRDGADYWSEVAELPGCFASGRTLTELHEAVGEAVGLYLWDASASIEPQRLSVGANAVDVRPDTGPALR